jgi:single stranded DNA-binding protein
MTPAERRASGSLATIFAARMLGLFLVLPVFALEAARYPGGGDPVLVGLAMGIYGLTQGLLQIPFGMASDRFGRKRVIVLGLLVFAAGSLLAAAAPSLPWLIAGRALQGAGAVSAAVTALLADQTRDVVRTKAMAMVGASIGLMFAVSLVAAPLLVARIGLAGLFVLTGALALACIAVVTWWTPPAPVQKAGVPRGRLADVLRHPGLLRLDVGVFVLHAVQLAMWVAVPALLVEAGLDKERHWAVYLPTVLASFVVMGGSVPAGAARLPAGGVPRFGGAAAGGAARAGGRCRPAVAAAAGRAAVPVLLRLQCAGGDTAQPGIAYCTAASARRRARCVQHAAIPGIFCRRRCRRLAGQERWLARAVRCLCRLDAVVAGRRLAHACAAGALVVRRRGLGGRGAGDIIDPTPERKSMASVNKVILIGNCGRDPEVRYLPSGQAVANVSVATTSKRKDKTSGESIEETQWHRVTFFDRLAEIVGEYVKKGRPIYVEGRLVYRKFTNKDGVEQNATDIIATEMQLLGGREGMGAPSGGDEEGGGAPRRSAPPGRAPAPAAQRPAASKPASGFDDMDDDIPF